MHTLIRFDELKEMNERDGMVEINKMNKIMMEDPKIKDLDRNGATLEDVYNIYKYDVGLVFTIEDHKIEFDTLKKFKKMSSIFSLYGKYVKDSMITLPVWDLIMDRKAYNILYLNREFVHLYEYSNEVNKSYPLKPWKDMSICHYLYNGSMEYIDLSRDIRRELFKFHTTNPEWYKKHLKYLQVELTWTVFRRNFINSQTPEIRRILLELKWKSIKDISKLNKIDLYIPSQTDGFESFWITDLDFVYR